MNIFQRYLKQSPANLWIILTYLALTIFMTWPLVTQLGTHLPAAASGGSDTWVHSWTFWWVKEALLSLRNPFYTDLLFHPNGVSLATHNIAWLNIGIWFPLQAAVGEAAAYSLTILCIFTLNAFCMYLLVHAWIGSRSVAFVGGLIYGFWPYTFVQSGQPNMTTIMWLPLVLYYLKRIADHGRRRDMLLAGLFIALTGIARWQLLLIAAILIGIFLLYLLIRSLIVHSMSNAESAKPLPFNKLIAQFFLAFLFAGLLMAPFAGPVIYTMLTQEFPQEALVHEPWFSSALLSYIIPNERLPFYSALVERLPEVMHVRDIRVDFVGYGAIFLALLGLLRRWRRSALWFGIALIYWTLALGPQLNLAQTILPNFPQPTFAMPYQWVEEFRLIQIVRNPHRFNAFVGLPLGLMAAYGLASLQQIQWLRRGSWLLAALFALWIVAEYRPDPYLMESVAIPQWYETLAEDPDDFAIFGLPPSPRQAGKYFMHYQTYHKKPMLGGHISRPTYTTFNFMDQSDYLWHLRIHRAMKPELVNVSHQLQLLVDANVRYLILHKNLLTTEQFEQFVDWLTFDPIYEDHQVVVYHADPQPDRDYTITQPLTPELGLLRVGVDRTELSQGESFTVDARWVSHAAPNRDIDACLTLRHADESIAQRQCYVIGGESPTSQWDGSDVARGDYTMRIAPLLVPMRYTLNMDLFPTNSDHATAISTTSLGEVNVLARERMFAPPPIFNTVDLIWADQIRLHGFDVNREGNQITVHLIWQALQRVDRSYKVFVHAVDESTDVLLAQNDSIPRQWTYPTTWWEADEYVDDVVALTLENVPAGRTRILVGLYDEETVVRLPVHSADGEVWPDDAAVLTILE